MNHEHIIPFLKGAMKVLAPIGGLVAIFLVVGLISGNVIPNRFLRAEVSTATNNNGDLSTTTEATTDTTNQTVTRVELSVYTGQSFCDGSGKPKQQVYLNLSPTVLGAKARVEGSGASHEVTLPSGGWYEASETGVTYNVRVLFPNETYALKEGVITSFVAKGVCAQNATTTGGTTGTTSTSTGTTTQPATKLVKFEKSFSELSCFEGAGSRAVTVMSEGRAGVSSLSIYSKNTGKKLPAILGTPLPLTLGSYIIVPSLLNGYILDNSTTSFEVAGDCPKVATTTPPIPGTDPSTTTPRVAPAFMLPPEWSEPEHIDHNIILTVSKDDSRVDTASGYVTLAASGIPTSDVRIFIGDGKRYRSDLVFSSAGEVVRASGTDRYKAMFNSKRIADGPWQLRAAYLSAGNYWVYSDPLPFTVKNAVEITLATTTKVETKPVTVATSVSPTRVVHTKPTINLVVGNRRITMKNPTFDREQLELRVSTDPAQRVQFLVLSTDGAISPAIRELGPGSRDEILSRNGIDVHTRFVDINLLPTGSYRFFARVRFEGGEQMDSDSWPVTISHLMQAPTVAPFGGEKSNVDIASEVTEETREDILKRVSDPSACTTQEECAVFCSSTNGAETKCTAFARAAVATSVRDVRVEVKKAQEETRKAFMGKIEFRIPGTGQKYSVGTTTGTEGVKVVGDWKAPEPIIRPSLVDTLPEDALKHIVDPASQLSAELPEEVRSVAALQSFCGVVEHIEKCQRIVTRLIPEATTTLEARAEVVRAFEQKALEVLDQRIGARAFVDTNGSGIPDYDKINIYQTDLIKRDTLGSGMSDGAILLGNGNPGRVAQVSTSSAMLVIGQNMAIENPKITGSTQKKLLAVASVATFEKVKDENGKEDAKRIMLKGKAPANSFVRVFMFSEPIVVTVKADEQGNWSYILDKTLPDGNHTAYAAIADASGRILAKSEPLPFVKVASAVSASNELIPARVEDRGMFQAFSPMVIAALTVALIGIALSIIGVVIGLRKSV
jgi:hypothetical protein